MEHTNQIIAWEVMFILVFSSLLIINSVENGGLSSITGYAAQELTRESILNELKVAVPKFDFVNDVTDGTLCLIVNVNPTIKYSYEIVKIGEVLDISASDNEFCKGEDQEDLIVSYISYDKLKAQMDNIPSFQQLKETSNGANFYIMPSKQILPGLVLANPQEFNQKFGVILENNFAPSEIQQILNPSTPESRAAASVISYTFYFIVGIIVLVGVLLTFIFTHAKKPEIKEDLSLVAYVKSALSQGYTQEQIIQSLQQSGWSNDKIQQTFNSINSGVAAPGTNI